jgi:hypothetical protein
MAQIELEDKEVPGYISQSRSDSDLDRHLLLSTTGLAQVFQSDRPEDAADPAFSAVEFV